MFRLPPNLTIGQQYQAVAPEAVSALESSLPPSSRVLVGLLFSERYDGFEADCERANEALMQVEGLLPWPEYPEQFVTPDADGSSIVWIHYQSSPAWWTFILIILGGIFILPIISVLPVWIIDLMFPGFTEMIGMIVMLIVLGGVVLFLPKMLTPAKEEK